MTTLSLRARLVLALTVCLVAATVASTAQTGRTRSLLSAATRADSDALKSTVDSTVDASVRRSRAVRVDLSILRAPGERQMLREPGISLELFPDLTLFAQFVRYDPSPGGMTWVGRVEGVPQSTVTLAYGGGLLSGTVALPNATYHIRPAESVAAAATASSASPVHLVSQIDQSALPREAEPIEVRYSQEQLEEAADTPMGDSADQIDVLMLYTAAAANHAGGQAGITNRINLSMSETNTSYANSGMPQRVRLVHAAPVNYNEGSNFSISLNDLRSGVGALSGVAALRDAHGADLVAMIIHPPPPAALCGIAFIMSQVSAAFASSAFSVTDSACLSPNFTLAHEFGHNMGARHDWYMDSGTTPFTYAHGYVNTSPNGRFRTIMSYPDLCTRLGFSCTRVLAWANPERQLQGGCDSSRFNCGQLQFWHYPGAPMGIPQGTATNCVPNNPANTNCDADDSRALNNTALTVANFRQAVTDRSASRAR